MKETSEAERPRTLPEGRALPVESPDMEWRNDFRRNWKCFSRLAINGAYVSHRELFLLQNVLNIRLIYGSVKTSLSIDFDLEFDKVILRELHKESGEETL